VSTPDYFISHAGIADNPGIDAESLAAMRREFANNPSQLAAREKGLFVRPEGLVLPFEPEFHMWDATDAEAAKFLQHATVFGGMDFQLWRFAFTLWGADTLAVPHLVEEYFSQRESLELRARSIHEHLLKLGITSRFPIYGDCANPQDILEVNLAFKRIKSPFRVTAVHNERKIVKAGVSRLENLMTRRNPPAFKVRRTIGALRPKIEEGKPVEWVKNVWKAGWNASSPGIPVEGSRWLWEVSNWQFPKTEEGKLTKENPDDATADGADMMACTRYAIMSWWKGAKDVDDSEREAFAPETLREDAEVARTIKHRLKRKREGTRRDIENMGGWD
jgi:hypothetical protein